MKAVYVGSSCSLQSFFRKGQKGQFIIRLLRHGNIKVAISARLMHFLPLNCFFFFFFFFFLRIPVLYHAFIE